MRSAGNFWAGFVHYLAFFRDVARLPIDWSRFAPYERLGRAGPRYLHQRFAIISERPLEIHRDAANRPHRSDGPHIRWRDGVEIHTIHGVRVTPRVTSGQFTAREALEERNAEVRRVMIAKYNEGDAGRWIRDLQADPIHEDTDSRGHRRRLLRIELDGDEPYVAIEVVNATPEPDGTHKVYGPFRCHPELRPLPDRGARHRDPEPQKLTCQNAIASLYGYYGHEYRPALET